MGNSCLGGKSIEKNTRFDQELHNSRVGAPQVKKKLSPTKGGSMALPESKNVVATRTDAVDSDVRQLVEFIDGQTFEEENFDSPFYMKIDKTYKVGREVVYPPRMDENVSFVLQPNEEKGYAGGTQVTFAYKSLQGRTEGSRNNKPNQDSVAIVRNQTTPDRAIFGVFDGHGPYGEHASHFCRMEMLRMYSIALKQHPNDSPEKILGHTLRYLDRKFGSTDHTKTEVDPIVSGTTAIVIMLDGDDIIAANIGDSRAILATRENKDEIVIVPLSDDHKPERADEKARIEASSAILMNENQVRNRRSASDTESEDDIDDGLPTKTYICRQTNGEIVYGVLFTRSIGDVDAHRHLGVSSEPEFRKEKVHDGVDSGHEQVIILGSDGVWDMMSNEECATIALSSMDPLVASEEIVKTCAERWATSGEGRRDDITVCVVGLGVKFGWSKTGVASSKDKNAGSGQGFYGAGMI
jgi:serine/threonine protein phosphatase PrpC